MYAIILPAMAMPMAFIILKSFFDAVPKDMYEAAKIDGYRLTWNVLQDCSSPIQNSAGFRGYYCVHQRVERFPLALFKPIFPE